MDLVGFSEERFNEIVADYKKFVAPLGIPDVNCIPLSALDGDNVVDKSERTPWYKGISLLDCLETVHIDNDHNFTDFRFPVQYVLRPNLDFRGFCGKVASGIVRKGDTVMALPSGKTSKVKSIVTYDGELDYAFPPQSVTLTLEDEIDVSRGEMLVHPDNLPTVDRNFEAMMVWMDEEPMDINYQFEPYAHRYNKVQGGCEYNGTSVSGEWPVDQRNFAFAIESDCSRGIDYG